LKTLAGVETSAALLTSFVLAMVHCPDIQGRAQAEIREVLGTSASPSIEDKPRLPYVTAVVKESLRWAAPAAFGMSFTK
jgi:cytochrome P450